MTTTAPLLTIEDLHVEFRSRRRRGTPVRAVDGVSFQIRPNQTVGLVGESGSGKSTIGRALLGLTKPTGGRIVLAEQDITAQRAEDRAGIARDLGVVFQDPYSSLNPARSIGQTLAEPLSVTGEMTGTEITDRISTMLETVRLPKDAAKRFPFAFSGGQRQRIAIARALMDRPKLVVCDEATSALDLVTQAQILDLLRQLQAERGLAYLFIAHNLPVVGFLADWVVVLYRGRIMEQGPASDVTTDPHHPYTKALLASVPVPDPILQAQRRAARAAEVSASTADAKPAPHEGCPFAPRCPLVADVCWTKRPVDTPVGDRVLACHAFDAASGHPAASSAGPIQNGSTPIDRPNKLRKAL